MPPPPPVYAHFSTPPVGVSNVQSNGTSANTEKPLNLAAFPAAINQFAFSPCGVYLAVASADGFLRVFDYHQMELVGAFRSYFGGLLCTSWSPDSRFVAAGGEDDLVVVWSLAERRVVCRCQGHKSWVTAVAFDPFVTSASLGPSDLCNSEEDLSSLNRNSAVPPTESQVQLLNGDISDTARDNGSARRASNTATSRLVRRSTLRNSACIQPVFYRFGSVGMDTNLCLWELTEDVIHPTSSLLSQHRTSVYLNPLTVQVGAGVGGSSGGPLVLSASSKSAAPPSSGASVPSTANAINSLSNSIPTNPNSPPASMRSFQCSEQSVSGRTSSNNNSQAVLSISASSTATLTNRLEDARANGSLSPSPSPVSIDHSDARSSTTLPSRGSGFGSLAKNKRSGHGAGAHFSSTFAQRILGIAHSPKLIHRRAIDPERDFQSPLQTQPTSNSDVDTASSAIYNVDIEGNIVESGNRPGSSRGSASTEHSEGAASIATSAPATASRKATSKVQRSKTQKATKESKKSSASLGSQTAHNSSSLSLAAAGSASPADSTSTGINAAIGATGDPHATGCTCRNEWQLLGTAVCPRLNQVPMIEPLLCKRVSTERLSELFFLDDCIITASADRSIQIWARPNRYVRIPTSNHIY